MKLEQDARAAHTLEELKEVIINMAAEIARLQENIDDNVDTIEKLTNAGVEI